MIAQINGKVIQKSDKYFVIQTNGIGYLLYVTTDLLAKIDLGKEISLWTHLIVREDVLDLYGFETIDEKNFFEMLISVSGIGPRSALSILSIAPMETIKKAIGSGDTSYLTKVSGIGRKTAEKIVVELRDKLASLGHKDESGTLRGESDVLAALQSLGYSLSDAREAVKQIPDEIVGTNERIKEALKILGR
ncbi:MAG: Holliday junction branch migration protein RuvA [Bacteroidetes bacterium]|nr:Holliday junction branch migration protein RuvA [Bacteroidota bacterium]